MSGTEPGTTQHGANRDGVAIVGVGCRLPGGAVDTEGFWELLSQGVDAIIDLPPDRYDAERFFDPEPAAPGKTYVTAGGYTGEIDQFDAAFFGISPREASRIDPQQRMLLEVTYEAIEDAGIPVEQLAGSRTGVFVAISTTDYGGLLQQPQNRRLIDAYSNVGTATSIAANRISYSFDLRGPSLSVDTACSSSLTAVHLACQSLGSGESTLAVAAGVQVLLSPEVTIGFSKATMLSPDARSFAFDARANGYVRGEGCVSVVLKPLAAALADGDPIYAVIRGTAINCDGRTNGINVPSRAGQEAVMREAYAAAGIKPARVSYVEAHGTGTPVGDPIEAASIAAVLGDGRDPADPCLIGSVKTNLGHLEAASGMAGLVKAALVLKHRAVPASLHFQTPNPDIPFADMALRVVTELQPLSDHGLPLVVGVNSFGFGGTNGHIVLEEAPPIAAVELAPARAAGGTHLLTLSARSPEALVSLADAYRALLMGAEPGELAEICAAAALRRGHHEHRLTVLGADGPTLADNLGAHVAGDNLADVVSGQARPGRPPRLVLVFAGMGPQWWGMGRQLMAEQPVFRATIEGVDARLRELASWSLLQELGRDEATTRVNEAELAQPTNFAIQAALFDLWRSWGIEPDVIVGHSAGEIAGCYAAGILSLEDAALVAFHRGRLQHRATGKGRMLSASISEGEALDMIAGMGGAVSLAANNSPRSVTLSGDPELLAGIEQEVTGRGLFCRFLPVDVPYHSRAMDPIEAELIETLASVQPRPATTRMVSTLTGEDLAGPEVDATYWWRCLRNPVRFGRVIGALADEGFDTFLEVSPHPVLSMSISECVADREGEALILPSLRRQAPERASMLRSLAALHCAGRPVDWAAVIPGQAGRASLPRYPWQHERHWFEGASEADLDAGTPVADPVLGRRFHTVQPTWEARLGDDRLAFLDTHLLDGVPVFPGAGYVAGVLAAARELNPEGPWDLRGVAFKKALFTADRPATRLQLALDPVTGSFEFVTVGEADEALAVHAAGRLVSSGARAQAWPAPAGGNGSGGPGDGGLEHARLRSTVAVDRNEIYRALAGRGLDYGPEFQGILEAWHGEGCALGRIGYPEAAGEPSDAFTVHPAILDAAFQVLVVAADTLPEIAGNRSLYVPIGIDSVTLHQPLPPTYFSEAAVTTVGDGTVSGNVHMYAADGTILLEIRGLNCQAIQSHGADTGWESWLYRFAWQPAPGLAGAAEGPALATTADVLAAASPRISAMAETSGWPVYYSGAEPALDRLAGGWVRTAMAELGWEPARGERFTSDSLADQLGIRPQRRLLFGRLVELMSRWGGITRDGSGWVVAGDAILDGPRSSAAEVIAAFPEYSEVARLVDRGGRGLPGVLRGTVESQEVLFGDGGMAEMTAFYTNAPPSRTFNQAVGEAVAALVDGRPEGAPLRVLELGAGTGGTTSAVLPVIPAGASYTFTDISPAFLAQARERFADQPSMTYQRLDVEAPIEAQGFEGGEFDIVIASNVLHATTDLRRTLANVHRLLAPGGMLVALEITRRPDWVEVVFGLTDGWWMFGDFDIRPDHALLDVETWPGMLEQAGFEAPVALTDGAAAADPAQSVFVAQRPSTDAAAAGGSWLILADTRGVGDALAAALIERGARCTIGRAGDSRRRVTEGELELQPGSVDDLGWALGEAAGGEGEAPPNPVRLVQLWSLDIPGQVDLDAEALMAAQRLGVGTAVAAVQALVARDVPGSRLWMVTAGAQEVDRGEPVASGQAPVWGLGRVVVNEHSDLGATMIDLPPDAGPESAAALAANLLRPEREEEIAIRDGSVFFRRLQRAVLEEAPVAAAGQPVEAFRLEIATPGSLESLTLRQTTRRAPGPGEVEVAVRAAGLNFRDIMFAMGMLPDLAIAGTFGGHELGFDCAGVVTRVGAGVEDLRVGDDVFGFAPASFGSHAVTSAALLRLKPKNIGFEDAASVPIAFATAVYALDRLARVSPDDTVLIHAGTGGVGLAALQVARRAGARVLATAGSDEKRAYLRDLGVEEVMDSRSLEFADRVMELTEGRGVDVILNSLAGDAIGAGLSVMAPHGRFVELGKRDVYEDLQVGLLAFRKNLSFFALDIDRLCAERPAVISELLTEIADDLVAGRLTSLPASSFPIEDAEGAFRMMAQAKHIGKVVISIHPEAGAGAAAPARPNLRDDGTYIVTGGLGGFGVEVARWLAELGAGHLALLGRTLRPEAEATIEAIRATGVEVTVATADVSDEASLRGALHSIRASMPPIRGVVHAAMVLDDCPVVDLNADRLRTVLAPKMMGAWNLDLLTREDPLDHFILFSSIAAVVGNPLQGNYCAANVFLDALAPARRARGLTATTVAWGVLRGAGYVSTRPEIGRYLERQGYLSFSPAEALRALEEVLIHDLEQVAVARVDWPRWALSAPSAAVSSLRLATLVPTASGGGAGGASGNSSLLTELAAATEGDRPGLVASHIQAAVARVLGTSREKIDVATPFTEIGLDSLMAVELMGSLKRDTGIEVPVVHLLEGVSAEQLGRRLAAQLEGALGAAPGGVAAAPVTKPVEAREVAPPAAAATAAPPADSPGLTTARGPVPDARRVAAANAERALKVVPPASAADRWPLSMRVVRGALMAFFAIVARVKVEGIEHVPARGAVVVAGNHLSFLDAPLMMSVLKRPTTLFAGEFLRRVPVVRAVLRRSGAIFVNRGEGDVDAVAAGLRVLADGGAVGLAPEGARSDTGGLKRGLTGAAYLAAAGGAPIVPVVAYGQERIASNWWRLRRSTVVIRFGPAMPVPSAVAGLELRRQTDDVMRTLAEMLPSEYRGEFADLAEPAARP